MACEPVYEASDADNFVKSRTYNAVNAGKDLPVVVT